MSMSKSLLAYDDVRSLLDKAVESERGIKVELKSHAEAMIIRHRMNSYRSHDRKKSREIYKETEAQFNTSPYDVLRFRVPKESEPDGHCIYIEKTMGIEYAVTEL